MLIINDKLDKYLMFSKYINGNDSQIQKMALQLKFVSSNDIELIKNTYYFVRDKINHSWDVQDRRVTAKASEVLREKVGICWAKSNLLAALLRANGIPTGICYQRITFGDNPESGYCIHALNAVYIKSMNKWIRLDARGNKEGISAEFSVDKEILAYSIKEEFDEVDYKVIFAEPLQNLMKILADSKDALYICSHLLPERI